VPKKRPATIRFPSTRRWEYLSSGGVSVSSYGVPLPFQEAFLRILIETRSFYRSLFGRHVIDLVEFNVRKSARLSHRLWTNGADRIYLTLSKKQHLEPTALSGVRNIHGVAHELAHIVLYRSLINLRCLSAGWGEGWAVYLASFVAVPHLYQKFGPSLWPRAFDFLETDGPEACLRQFDPLTQRQWNPVTRVIWQLHALDDRLGRGKFIRLLRAQVAVPVRADAFNREMNRQLRLHGVLDWQPPKAPSRSVS